MVREFRDLSSRSWRAWDIRPEAVHPQTKAEDYLADCYETGWIVFETTDGRAKRRLCPYPKAWDTLPDNELLGLLARAEAVPSSKLTEERNTTTDSSGSSPRWRRRADDMSANPPGESAPDVTDLVVGRSFRYPVGRLWSVRVVPHPDDAGPPVLRFTAGARSIDLRQWPRDWPDYPEERLVELLRLAAPRRLGASVSPETPRRRYTDPPT